MGDLYKNGFSLSNQDIVMPDYYNSCSVSEAAIKTTTICTSAWKRVMWHIVGV